MLFSVDHGEYQEKSILITTTKTILEIHQTEINVKEIRSINALRNVLWPWYIVEFSLII